MYLSKEKITIVVPCYNVEKYLVRCLESIINQDYKNIEVIMVEDCSTDKTKEIVQEYEKRFSNFRAIYNKKNGGLGNARNVGILATQSKYLCFLDSDDWLPNNFVSEMLGAIMSANADLSVCDVYLRYDDPEKDQRIPSYSVQPDKFGLINTGLAATSSAKLFKTELFDDLKYPVDMVNEDIPVTLAILYNYNAIYTSRTHFNYYQRPGSIQNGRITPQRLDVFKALSLLRNNTKDKIDKKTWDAIVWQQAFALYLYVLPRARGYFDRKRLIERFYFTAKEHGIRLSLNNPGFRSYLKENKLNSIYGPRAVRYLNKKSYIKASVLMGFYSFAQNNMETIRWIVKLLRLTGHGIVHPIQFTKRVKNKITQKHVINLKVTMGDLIRESKRQHQISGRGIVSVVIPNYNYEHFLLQRVYSILYQTEKLGEIIILDDNSTDGSLRLANEIKQNIGHLVPIRLIYNKKNRGTFSQWELGFKKAQCSYVWIAEADDYCDCKFLETAIMPLKINTNVVISYVNTGFVDSKGLLLGDVKDDIDYQKSGHWDTDYINNGHIEATTYSYLNNTIANVSSVVFHKKTGIDYVNLFEEARKYRQAGDWVFYVNYMLYGDVAYKSSVLNYYRMHGNNISSNTKAQDHMNEIVSIQEYFTKKLELNHLQKALMAKRVELLKRAWKI